MERVAKSSPLRVFDPAEPPAFGQVWRWHGVHSGTMMLLSPDEGLGVWHVWWFHSGERGPMYGLHDDPKRRLGQYERLA